MKILLATSNPHKLQEIRDIFEQCAAQAPAAQGQPARRLPTLISLADLDASLPEPVEDGDTFEANAVKKASHYAKAANLPCLADDSGLEVDALGKEPGVRSARYAGAHGPRAQVDQANNKLLLERLGDTPPSQRTAQFVCAMALAFPQQDRPPIVVRGVIEGRIITPEQADDPQHPHRGRGANGFGYDPLFWVPQLGKTTAQLSPQQKNAISHRGQAARQMFKVLEQLGWIE